MIGKTKLTQMIYSRFQALASLYDPLAFLSSFPFVWPQNTSRRASWILKFGLGMISIYIKNAPTASLSVNQLQVWLTELPTVKKRLVLTILEREPKWVRSGFGHPTSTVRLTDIIAAKLLQQKHCSKSLQHKKVFLLKTD